MILPNAKHFERENTEQLSASLAKPASYKLLYWNVFGVAGSSRDMLEYGGAKWENLKLEGDWSQEKLATPFHVLPVLSIKTEDGKDLTISETNIVELYLAKQFGLLGSNDYEENLVRMCHSSSSAVQINMAITVTWNLPKKHLADNGNNGHYVGNKLTLADIRTANVIDHWQTLPEGKEIMEKVDKSEALMKVHAAVVNEPRIATWRASKLYCELEKSSRQFFANPFAVRGG
ncbi:Glutathione S-transferase S1 [Mortierella alpina]|nr:Glutathione S-transferase S1 [Mortierella alpina]